MFDKMPSIQGEMNKLEAAEAEKKKKELYEKAAGKARSFIERIDPELRVRVQTVPVLPEGRYPERELLVLSFEHGKNPDLNWDMEIGESDAYIENEFEGVLKDIYEKTQSEHDLDGKIEAKARSVMQSIGPEWSVSVEIKRVPAARKNQFPHLEKVLAFDNNAKPEMSWDMAIGEDEGYIENELEEAIKRTYEARKSRFEGRAA
jgi:hypothetical protein